MMHKLKVTLAAGLAAAVVLTSIGIGEAEARSRQSRNNAAAAAAMIGIVGTIAAIAVADSRRDRYYDNGYRYRGQPYRGRVYNGQVYRGRPYRGSQAYQVPPQYRNDPAAYPIRNGLMPNNLPVGDDPRNPDPTKR